MLRIRQLKGHDPQFGLAYALMSDAPFGLVAKVACGDQELYGREADRAALAWARRLAAVPDLIVSLRDMTDMFERHINGQEGPDDAAQRYDAAREALKNAGVQ